MHYSKWLGFAVILLAGCNSAAAPDPANVPRDPYPDAKTFFNSIKHYPYTAPAERSARMAIGFKQIRVCMTKSEVRTLLGSPDYSEISFGPKGPRPHWLGYYWTYYQSMRSDDVNMHDPNIQIFFDKTGRVLWAVPQAMPGFHETGAPEFVCRSRI